MVSDDTTLDRVFARAQRIHERVVRAEAAAYERGLRRGMAIAGDHMREYEYQVFTIDYDAATEQMEREIEEAKR